LETWDELFHVASQDKKKILGALNDINAQENMEYQTYELLG